MFSRSLQYLASILLLALLIPAAGLSRLPPESGALTTRNKRVYAANQKSDLYPGNKKELDRKEVTPLWLTKLIAREKRSPPANPPARVVRYTYKGQTVYYIPPRCCDVPSRLYDLNGERICSPGGGMTGAGDRKCPDFFNERKNEKVIWKDSRTWRK